MDFPAALRSFSGYLQGTGKAEHTIRNYRWDILHFARFLASLHGMASLAPPRRETARENVPRIRLSLLTRPGLDAYHAHLKKQGLKTNTRRRRMITVGRFLAFLAGRKKLPEELGRKIPTPHKIERIPFTLSQEALIGAIRALPSEAPLEARNRAILWVLAETGCSVSEVARIRVEDVSPQGTLSITGKLARSVVIPEELAQCLLSREQEVEGRSPWLFRGWNRYRALPTAITPRGIELVVKEYSEKLLGDQEIPADSGGVITPRTLRHSAVMAWLREGVSREEIQKRLGLKSAYAFRVYEPLLKSSLKTTSSAEKPRKES